MNPSDKKHLGFTLLEVLIAMTILVGGMVIMSTSWTGNFMRVRKATLYNNVALLLERKMVEIQAEYTNKSIEEIVDKSGDFGSDQPLYRWEFKTHEFKMPDLSAAILGKNGGQNEMFLEMVKQSTEFISKSIKEGTVTIFVKTGGKNKEMPFSVTTYFIDYNREMPLPGGLPSNPQPSNNNSNDSPAGGQKSQGKGT
ncbi:MAG: type II secretion system GspH family protein [Bdellovibrionales bacterium]|nr:type II secretion system GspH family protein [Bdellovibrionales bacterium]